MLTVSTMLATIALGLTTAPARPLGHATSADTLRGRVEDLAGRPLAGAAITVVEVGLGTTTDANGVFVIPDLAAGRYSLLARLTGYKPMLLAISLPATGDVIIQLTARAFELPPVTVTATRSPVDPRLATMPVDELGPESLRRENGVSLAHAVEGLAGVHTLSTGEQVGKPVIRGLSGSRVLVLADALRLEDYSWSDEDGPSVDARLADRVEVIRGPASMLYGSDAMGGVVNVVSAPLPNGIGRSPFLHGGLEAYGASNNRETGGVLRLEGASGAFGWRAMGVGRFAEEFHTPDGPVENTGFGSVSGEAAAGLRGAWGNATVRYTHFGGEFKLLEADGPPGGVDPGEEEGPERKLGDERVQLSGNFPLAERARLEVKTQWQRHSLIEVGDTAGAAPGQETTQFDLLLNTMTADVMAHQEIGSHVVQIVGVSGILQSSDSRGPEPIVPDDRVRSGALFALEQVAVGPVQVSVGGRVDVRRLEVDPNRVLGNVADTRKYSVVSASGGAAYTPMPGITIRANVGRAWRAPTVFELYSNGPRIGEALYEIGRADLTPESSLNLDGGVEFETHVFRLSVSAYRNRIGDFIFLAPTDQFQGGLRIYEHDQAPAVLWGGEAALDVRPIEPLTLRGRADYVYGANLSTHEPLPLMPPPSGALGAELASADAGWIGRSYVNVETEVFAKQTRLSTFDVPTDGYALVNVGGGISPRVGGRTLHLDVQVHNLLDQAYRNYLSRYKEFALNPGRNVVVRLGTAF